MFDSADRLDRCMFPSPSQPTLDSILAWTQPARQAGHHLDYLPPSEQQMQPSGRIEREAKRDPRGIPCEQENTLCVWTLPMIQSLAS